jgi:hypothetical protein
MLPSSAAYDKYFHSSSLAEVSGNPRPQCSEGTLCGQDRVGKRGAPRKKKKNKVDLISYTY